MLRIGRNEGCFQDLPEELQMLNAVAGHDLLRRPETWTAVSEQNEEQCSGIRSRENKTKRGQRRNVRFKPRKEPEAGTATRRSGAYLQKDIAF
jgi:hypothetical protein